MDDDPVTEDPRIQDAVQRMINALSDADVLPDQRLTFLAIGALLGSLARLAEDPGEAMSSVGRTSIRFLNDEQGAVH